MNRPLIGFLVFVIALLGLQFKRDHDDWVAALAGCERGNGSRNVTLDLSNALVEVNKRRVKAASSEQEADANRFALELYRANRTQLLDLIEDDAVAPGSVEVDCEEQYPRPFYVP